MQAGLVEMPAFSILIIVLPLLFGAVGTRLFLMFARALHATEADRNRLAAELKALTAEFDHRVEHLTAQRVDQFTERERKRIASDLHDDLGAKLLTIVHTATARAFRSWRARRSRRCGSRCAAWPAGRCASTTRSPTGAPRSSAG